MKNICVVLAFWALVSTFSHAQKKDIHSIELLPNDSETVLVTDFYISEIIDNRILKTNIGIAQKGLMNRKVLSDFSKDFDVELLEYLSTILPVDSTKTALSLRINQLLISEHTGAFKETGKAIVRLDVLEKDNLNNYSALGSFTAERSKNSMDVTRKHDDRIRAVLKDCMVQFDSLDWKSITPDKIDITRPKEAKIINEGVAEGFFKTYTELANNDALSNLTFRVQNRSTDEKLHLKDSLNKKITHFAYYDGEAIFLNASTYSGERHYIKTERLDSFLLFTDIFVNQDNVSGMSMAFGVLGVLASNERQTVLFDLNSGQFHALNRSKMRLILKNDYPDLYKKFKRDSRNYELAKEIITGLYEQESPEVFREMISSTNK